MSIDYYLRVSKMVSELSNCNECPLSGCVIHDPVCRDCKERTLNLAKELVKNG